MKVQMKFPTFPWLSSRQAHLAQCSFITVLPLIPLPAEIGVLKFWMQQQLQAIYQGIRLEKLTAWIRFLHLHSASTTATTGSIGSYSALLKAILCAPIQQKVVSAHCWNHLSTASTGDFAVALPKLLKHFFSKRFCRNNLKESSLKKAFLEIWAVVCTQWQFKTTGYHASGVEILDYMAKNLLRTIWQKNLLMRNWSKSEPDTFGARNIEYISRKWRPG